LPGTPRGSLIIALSRPLAGFQLGVASRQGRGEKGRGRERRKGIEGGGAEEKGIKREGRKGQGSVPLLLFLQFNHC